MKIKKWVTCEKEVDVVIGVDDIAAAITEGPDGLRGTLRAFNNIITFFTAIPDDILSQFNNAQREIITENLMGLLARIKE